METREQFLCLLWEKVINAGLSGRWIDAAISEAQRRPDGAFSDAGRALARLLALRADRNDLTAVTRAAVYEAVFAVLYMLDDPGVLGGEVFMLHESLLSADPSGRDGRPVPSANG